MSALLPGVNFCLFFLWFLFGVADPDCIEVKLGDEVHANFPFLGIPYIPALKFRVSFSRCDFFEVVSY